MRGEAERFKQFGHAARDGVLLLVRLCCLERDVFLSVAAQWHSLIDDLAEAGMVSPRMGSPKARASGELA